VKRGIFIVMTLLILPFALTRGQEGDEPDVYFDPPDDPPMPEYVWSMAWSPDGNRIALGAGPEVCRQSDNDYSVRIISAATGDVTNNLIYHNCSVTDLDWDPDGAQLVTTSDIEGEAYIWDIDTGQRLTYFYSTSMPGFIDNIWNPNPNYNQVASISSATRDVTLWNPVDGQVRATFDADFPRAIAWNPDGSQLATGGASGDVRIWNAATGQLIMTLLGQTHSVSAIAWSPDGNQIASVEVVNNSIQLWDTATGAPLLILQGHTDRINRVIWSPETTQLASASYDGAIRIWDTETGEVIEIIDVGDRLFAMDWRPDGCRLAYATESTTIHIVPIDDVCISEKRDP
jgi:WD40 repeat protein